MMMNLTEYLQLMTVHNVGAVFVKADFKKEFIFLGNAAGQSLGITQPLGLSTNVIELPREIFDDLLAARLIKQDGEENEQGQTFYSLTEDGLACGKLQ